MDERSGRRETVAFSVARLTDTEITPSTLPTAFSIRLAQVMPPIATVCFVIPNFLSTSIVTSN
jgi:hypothetical protein